MIDRRELLKGGAATAAFLAAGGWLPRLAAAAEQFVLPAGALGEQAMDTLPGKVALIRKTFRPPNYETPLSYFREAITPNNAFFVRYHLAGIPEIDPKTWKLKIGGAAASPAEFTLADLRAMEQVEVTAVCQCSGNRRGFADPHVPGVEWGFGAMGNARWRGVRLKDLLAKAGIAKEAIEVSFSGADGPVLDKTPDFVKSIPVWKAMEETTLVAFDMNGEPLPHFNGGPARVIVPGWTGTYWVKNLIEINPLTQPEKNYWMSGAYRVPKALFPVVQRFVSQEAPEGANTPITEMVVNSLITSHENGAAVKAGAPLTVAGIAWDGGYGIAEVAVSTDGGATWKAATLGPDLGKYSFRTFSATFTPAAGAVSVMARARNRIGQSQVDTYLPNGPGYHNNIVQKLDLKAA